VLARRIELQGSSSKMQDVAAVATAEEVLGMDALQLLMDSYDPDEIHELEDFELDEELMTHKKSRHSQHAKRNGGASRILNFFGGTEGDTDGADNGEGRKGRSTFMAQHRGHAQSSRQSSHGSTGLRTKYLHPLTKRRLSTKAICEAFFHDPANVLFFYSQAEDVRTAIKVKQGLMERHELPVDDTRTEDADTATSGKNVVRSAFRVVCDALRDIVFILWNEYKEAREHDPRKEPVVGGVATNLGSSRKTVKEHVAGVIQRVNEELAETVDYDWCDGVMNRMFSPEVFLRGMELQVFQLGLIALEHARDADLIYMQDAFHEHWYKERWVTEQRIKLHKGYVTDASMQTKSSMADNKDHETEGEEEAWAQAQRSKEPEKVSIADIRWMRIIIKMQTNLIDSKYLPTMSELGQILRKRRGGEDPKEQPKEAASMKAERLSFGEFLGPVGGYEDDC